MIKNLVVEVERRENSGKNAARRHRRASRIPAIVYGSGEPAEAIVVSPRRLEEILRLESGRNTIFSIAAPGGAQPQPVMIKELQRDPSSDRVLHIDLIRVQLDKAVTVSVGGAGDTHAIVRVGRELAGDGHFESGVLVGGDVLLGHDVSIVAAVARRLCRRHGRGHLKGLDGTDDDVQGRTRGSAAANSPSAPAQNFEVHP